MERAYLSTVATALSAASAAFSAASPMSVTTALILGLTASVRSRYAWTTSRDDRCLALISAASVVASR